MHIVRIHIAGYGRFLDWASPDFGPGLNVVLGANEAGKSTLRAFLLDVLFGFEPKVRGRHPYNPWASAAKGGLDFGGEIELDTPDGRRLRLRRFLRGRTPHFRLEDVHSGQSLTETDLGSLIPVSRGMYEQLFALDLAELAALDQKTAESVMERFAADFETLGEIASPTDALRSLGEQIGEIQRRGRRGARLPKLTRFDRELKEVKRFLREAREEAARLPGLYEQRDQLRAQLETLREEHIRSCTRQARLKALGPLQDVARRLQQTEERLAELAGYPDVAPEQHEKIEAVLRRMDALREEVRRLEQEMDEAVRAEAEAAETAVRFQAVRETGEERIEQACALVEALGRLQEEKEQLTAEIRKLDEDLRRDAQTLRDDANPGVLAMSARDDPEAISLLETGLDRIGKLQDELTQVQGRYEAFLAAVREAEEEVGRLEKDTPSDFPEDFSTRWLPAAERAAESLREYREAEERLRRKREERDRAESVLSAIRSSSVMTPPGVVLAVAGVIATALAVFAFRDGLRWLSAALGVTAFVFGTGMSVTAWWRRRVRVEQGRRDLQRLDADIDEVAAGIDGIRSRLSELWREAGLTVDSLGDGDALRVRLEALRRWNDAAPAVERLCDARQRLAKMQRVLEDSGKDVRNLEDAIEQAWREVESIRERLGITVPLDRDVGRERRRAATLTRLFDRWREKEKYAERLDRVERRLEQNRNLVQEVLDGLGLGDTPVEDAAAVLRRTLRESVRVFQRLESAQREHRRSAERLDKRRAELEELEHDLAEALKEIGVGSLEEFRAAVEAAEERRRLRARREEDLETLGRHRERFQTAVRDLDAAEAENVVSETEAFSEEKAQALLEELKRIEVETAGRIEQIEADLRDVEHQITEIEKKADLEVLRSRKETLEAGIADLQRRRDVLVFTEYLLKEAVETFEREHRLPVLERASDYLRRFTGGAYVEVVLKSDESPTRMLQAVQAAPAGGGVPRDAGVLSRGTAEQVYLALRLALAVEMAGGRALPFLLDDVLVNADPDRLDGCVERLAEFASETQVLLFTCHPHIAERFEKMGASLIPLEA